MAWCLVRGAQAIQTLAKMAQAAEPEKALKFTTLTVD
jgi:hypothetical protein